MNSSHLAGNNSGFVYYNYSLQLIALENSQISMNEDLSNFLKMYMNDKI